MTQSLLLSQKQASPTTLVCMDHCCRKRHYSFEVRKCGSIDCNICKPVRLPPDVFQQMKPLPDPTPGVDNHFLPFEKVFGCPTSEEHRPSLHTKKQKKTLPFSASVQHVKNVDMMLLCEECAHFEPQSIQFAKESEIVIFCLPPHTTHESASPLILVGLDN